MNRSLHSCENNVKITAILLSLLSLVFSIYTALVQRSDTIKRFSLDAVSKLHESNIYTSSQAALSLKYDPPQNPQQFREAMLEVAPLLNTLNLLAACTIEKQCKFNVIKYEFCNRSGVVLEGITMASESSHLNLEAMPDLTKIEQVLSKCTVPKRLRQ